MFIHFGMSTFDGYEHSPGDKPAHFYNPTELDVDQWIRTASEAGMRYAVLTTKHVAGFCLWPSKHTDYHVGNSANSTDVVKAFVDACHRYGLKPGFYYCSFDNHNLFGSVTIDQSPHPYTTQAYRQFQLAQIEELLTQYGPIEQVWIDCPGVLQPDGRLKQYEQIARLQPDALIMMNTGFGDGTHLKQNIERKWPTDLVAIERGLPASALGYQPWHDLSLTGKKQLGRGPAFKYPFIADESQPYYIPGEVCDTIGYSWFYLDDDPLRSVAELLGMRLVSRQRGANFLLNVPPDRRGLIPQHYVNALTQLRSQTERIIVET